MAASESSREFCPSLASARLVYASLFSPISNQIGESQDSMAEFVRNSFSWLSEEGVLIAWHRHYFDAEELGLHVAWVGVSLSALNDPVSTSSSSRFPTPHFVPITLSFFNCLTSALAYSLANLPKSVR
jgi:hypothetical protein